MKKLNVLILNENGWWVAQCLDFDMTVQFSKLIDAESVIKREYDAHIQLAKEYGQEPFVNLGDTPHSYKCTWEIARVLETIPSSLDADVENVLELELRIA